MSHVFEPAARAERFRKPRRGPAIVLVAVAMLGIITDRLRDIPLDTWLWSAVALVFSWLLCYRCLTRQGSQLPLDVGNSGESSLSHRELWLARISASLLLAGWFCLSGAWHHWHWNCRGADDIANSARDEPQLVRVVGKIIQSPWIIHHSDSTRASWQTPDQTILILECRYLMNAADQQIAVSGTARAMIDGALTRVALGDVVEFVGEILLPTEPANPGDFDQRSYLRAQGIATVLRTNHLEAVTVKSRERTVWDWLLVFRNAVRTRAEELIASRLKPETAPVAQAMLLGSRVQIDDETRRAFRESGMLHVLAISGMNVGLLWTWLWTLSRSLGASARTSTWVVLIALPIYALVTDANPPIVRATVVAVIIAFGQLIGRQGSVGNSLALAGLCVLAWNPTDLFNTGAQLSFLAVFAILHATSWLTLVHQQTQADKDDAPLHDSPLRRVGTWTLRAIFDANVVGLAVWFITSPLVAKDFHLVSPIGSLLTVLLSIPMTIMFWIGYSFLLLGLISSSTFGWLGSLFDQFLTGFLWSVRTGARLDYGHVYVPAPPIWWTWGFYMLTLIPLLSIRNIRWGTGISVRAGLAWIVIGMTWGLSSPPRPGVTCTFISVGHGLGVLIEFPNGRTVLYDAGGMVGGGTIGRTISQTLWSTGRSRLDAVILSHADGDHCNGLPELTRFVVPGGLYVHRSFLDWSQPPVAAAIEQSASAGAAVQLISEGQALTFDPNVTFRVLHPPPDFRSRRDNPNSLVIAIEYAGRRILLTGDLELDGLERLLTTPPLDVDVLLSPHHGSLKANPADLARWASPEYVVISTPERAAADRLEDRYGPETQILTTAAYGAIRCQISPDGDLQVEPYKRHHHAY